MLIQKVKTIVGFVANDNDVINAGDTILHKGTWKEVIYSDEGVLEIRDNNECVALVEIGTEIKGYKRVLYPSGSMEICVSTIESMSRMFNTPEHVVRYYLNRPVCNGATHGEKGERLILSMKNIRENVLRETIQTATKVTPEVIQAEPIVAIQAEPIVAIQAVIAPVKAVQMSFDF